MLSLFSAARQNVSRQHSVLCNRILRENSDLNAVDFTIFGTAIRCQSIPNILRCILGCPWDFLGYPL